VVRAEQRELGERAGPDQTGDQRGEPYRKQQPEGGRRQSPGLVAAPSVVDENGVPVGRGVRVEYRCRHPVHG
jgi:hypothetical protein